MSNYNFDEEFSPLVQKKFLSLLIFDQKWATIHGLDIIKPEFFENRVLYNFCKWIRDYYKKYKTVPTKLVLEEMIKDFVNKNDALSHKDFYTYREVLDQIYEITESDSFEFFKEKAVDFAKQVAWKKALEKGGDCFKEGNYEEALTKFREVLSYGTENDLGLDFSEISLDEFINVLGQAYDKSNMLKTGIEGWDRALGGGFVNRNVHIIAGPPGSGKSRTMAFLTKQALTDFKKVIFITLELSEAETMANIYTSATGIGLHEMLNPINRMEFTEKVSMFKDTYGADLVIKFFKPSSVTADTIHNYIQKVIQYKEEKLGRSWKPDVIFLDYMDKLLPTQKVKDNVYKDGEGVATDCKNLGITFECPVITGSQLGRYSWTLTGDAVVSMDSIAESAAKVHLAHSMTTINFNKGEKEQGKARLYLAKSRSGRPGTVVWCENNLGRCLINEVEQWDPNTLQSVATFTIKDSSSK